MRLPSAGEGIGPTPHPEPLTWCGAVWCGAGGQQYASPENSARLQRVGDWEWGVDWCKGGEDQWFQVCPIETGTGRTDAREGLAACRDFSFFTADGASSLGRGQPLTPAPSPRRVRFTGRGRYEDIIRT